MKLWKKWWARLNAVLSEALRFFALLVLAIYRSIFVPLVTTLFGDVCRFQPSCSRYAQIAFQQHPPLTAGWFTLRRLCKCHPMGPFGDDPVPERKLF